ncbi:hypothetical protein [Rhizorhabdus argentea]|uniref:hypothetical protein n=1 Tax=Rhizorhabdus argentea TaxID=1387174 RepID=UPI0030ED09AC
MELSASAVTGAMRIGVQIATAYRGPHLEIYYQVINQFGPETTYHSLMGTGDVTRADTIRSQDLYIQFLLVNVGGMRATNVKLTRAGDFCRASGRDFGGLFEVPIAQMPPGQVLQLFLLDAHELDAHGEDGRKIGIQEGSLSITVDFDAPRTLLSIWRYAWARIRRKSQHRTMFEWRPDMVMGDTPPPRFG